MSLYEEFPDIAINGNAARRAERAPIVAASSTIVTSLGDAVFKPVIDLFLGRFDLSEMFVGSGNPNSVAVPSLAALRQPGARRLLSVCSSMLL
jgi:large-conductance mechanosensitive channel